MVVRFVVPILKQAPIELRQRLLELFPVTNLRSAFAAKGTKEAIAKNVATTTTQAQLDKVAEFVDENMALCKQHVYFFQSDEDVILPDALEHAERVIEAEDHALFISTVKFNVVKEDPLEYDSIDFLWPIRVEAHGKYLLVRFVVLEKNILSYFSRNVIVRGRSLTEELITAPLLADGTLGSSNLNRGIKRLWAKDKVDATRIRFKKPGSMNTQNMDEAKELKKNDPAMYEELKKLDLYSSMFKGFDELAMIGNFAINPSEGTVGFVHYAKEGGIGDELIRQILANN